MKILVLYGGAEATQPREELLSWLRGPHVGVDARVVADAPPHTDGTVDDRVDEAIAWADGAIVLVTPDARTSNSPALNVMDEMGRWRSAKGKATLCAIRQEGVQLPSNYGGIIYGEFKERISEKFELIRRFMMSLKSGEQALPTDAQKNAGELLVDATPGLILLNGTLLRFSDLKQGSDKVTVTLVGLDGTSEAAVRQLERGHLPVEAAFGNTAISSQLRDCQFGHDKDGVKAILTLRDTREEYGGGAMEISGGTPGTSADEIAKLRTSRILFNEPAPNEEMQGAELFIRGIGERSRSVKQSPIRGLLSRLPAEQESTWEVVRLSLVRELRLSDCVENVERLRLHVQSGKLDRIKFRGTRRVRYSNVPPFVIEFDRKL